VLRPRLAPHVWQALRAPAFAPPRGALLGWRIKEGLVDHLFLDLPWPSAPPPDLTHLNRLLAAWNAHGVRLAGFTCAAPGFSSSTLGLAARILEANPGLPLLLLGLSSADPAPCYRFFLAYRASFLGPRLVPWHP